MILSKYKYYQSSFYWIFLQYIIPIIILGIVILICIPFSNINNYHVISYILLFLVSIFSTIYKVGTILFISTLSALAWNFFFIPPNFTFHIDKTDDILIFGLFFSFALTNGILTSKVKKQKRIAIEREQKTNSLFELTKELSKATGINQVIEVSIKEIKKNFKTDSIIFLQDGNSNLKIIDTNIKDKNIIYNNANIIFQKQTLDKINNSTYIPLIGNKLNPGVIVLLDNNKNIYTDEYFNTFIVQISNAIEREFLAEMAQKLRLFDESDRLYKTLFNSISHELRIPVATIMGASDTIINSQNNFAIHLELCKEIFTASLRLNRLIENLLNMSRLESGHISIRLDWCDILDIINKVVDDLTIELSAFNFSLDVQEEMPPVKIDFGLFEQIFYNLIYNATLYTPKGSNIFCRIKHENNILKIEIEDSGKGFSETDLINVFKKFFRVNKGKTGGLGLGLSIVKGFVEAHNGDIFVKNSNNGGAIFNISVPSPSPILN
jgi:K+-sensing histidine kinase KdpD